MAIDKFGRTPKRIGAAGERGPRGAVGEKGPIGPRGPPGITGMGFLLNEHGNYNMKQKRLKNVGMPWEDTDAASKAYVDKQIPESMQAIKDEIIAYVNKEHNQLENFVYKHISSKGTTCEFRFLLVNTI